jgi:nitroreductase
MTTFEQIKNNILSRRSISWKKMNGKIIPNETVNELLELAHWAPTHGRTEPWQFLVYSGDSLQQFGQAHADLYWQHTAEDKRLEATYEKLKHNVDKASHLVVSVMKRGDNPKITQLEEIAAASAAIQNILLGATALGIASFWSTGGMTHARALKDFLALGHEDVVLGLIFLGYTDEMPIQGMRKSIVSEKVKWL